MRLKVVDIVLILLGSRQKNLMQGYLIFYMMLKLYKIVEEIEERIDSIYAINSVYYNENDIISEEKRIIYK